MNPDELYRQKLKAYMDFCFCIEGLLTSKRDFNDLNIAYSKVILFGSDKVVLKIKEMLKDNFNAKSRRSIYLEMRKDSIRTKIDIESICYFSTKKIN